MRILFILFAILPVICNATDLSISLRNLTNEECRLVKKVLYNGQYFRSNAPEVLPANGEGYYVQISNDSSESSLELLYNCGGDKLAHFVITNTHKYNHSHMSINFEPIQVENIKLTFNKEKGYPHTQYSYIHGLPSKLDIFLR